MLSRRRWTFFLSFSLPPPVGRIDMNHAAAHISGSGFLTTNDAGGLKFGLRGPTKIAPVYKA